MSKADGKCCRDNGYQGAMGCNCWKVYEPGGQGYIAPKSALELRVEALEAELKTLKEQNQNGVVFGGVLIKE